MMSKTVRKLAVYCLAVATLFLNGCGPSEQEQAAARRQAIADGLEMANRVLYSGQTGQALSQLEALDQQYPNEPEILEALAFAYAKQPDHAMAAFYFDSVVQMEPSRADLALYAARSHSQTGDWASAARAYTVYLQDSPQDGAAWRALAQVYTKDGQTKPALDAWLQSKRNSPGQPSSQDLADLGDIYLKLGNNAQARASFENSLKAPAEGNARTQALMGLIELDFREKQWAAAEKRITELDKIDPAALDNSPMAPARLELQNWHKAKAELERQRLAAVEIKEKPAVVQEDPVALTEASGVNPEAPRGSGGTITVDRTGETISIAGNTGELALDVDKSMTLPGPPAHSEEQRMPSVREPERIEPTPLADGSTGTDESTTAEMVEPEASEPEVEPAALADGSSTTASDAMMESGSSARPLSDDQITPAPTLQERADIAYAAKDYLGAISLYQMALANSPNAAPVYYGLSRAYYEQQQWPQAELYASEAMRLDPNDLRYTVNFLRAIQRTQSTDRLMQELVKAKRRFPNSADITLALARGYERLYDNRRNARILYEEFLTIAPEHPQASTIRAHVQTLR